MAPPSDTSNQSGAPTTPVVVVATTPTQPTSWLSEAGTAVWNGLTELEQWLVSDLHEAGYIFSHDIWPALKAALAIFGSQVFPAIFGAVTANLADPALVLPAVGAAIVLTSSTVGVIDAKNFIASAEANVAADPTVQALINPQPSAA